MSVNQISGTPGEDQIKKKKKTVHFFFIISFFLLLIYQLIGKKASGD